MTFNYDRIIEYYLINCFRNTFSNNNAIKIKFSKYGYTEIEKYFGFSIDHVYGSIGDLKKNPIDEDNVNNIENFMNDIGIIGNRSHYINRTKERLKLCDRIFFLGYGFDSQNNYLLDLKDICKGKEVYGTCFEYLDEEIERVKKSIYEKGTFVNCDCKVLLRKYLI